MAYYSRARFRQLKKDYTNGIVLLSDNYCKLWTFDDDAENLADELGIEVQYNRGGIPFLSLPESALDEYVLQEIEDEDGAFFLPYGEEEQPSLPPSALIKTVLHSEDGDDTIIIVSDGNEQDSANGIYGEWRGLAKTILQAIDDGVKSFSFKEKNYEIASVYYTPKYQAILEHRYHFLDPESEAQTLNVYSSKSYTAENGLEPVTALFFYPGSPSPAGMTVYYSTKKDEYFVDQAVFNLFRVKHGLPYVSLSAAPGESFPSHPEMANESVLHLYGYNVSEADGLTEQERQGILARLMDYGIVSKGKIENHLKFMVFLGEKHPNMGNAVEKWKRDLLFANTYKLTDQRTIWITGIYYKNKHEKQEKKEGDHH